jgi:hypothetical protein
LSSSLVRLLKETPALPDSGSAASSRHNAGPQRPEVMQKENKTTAQKQFSNDALQVTFG